MSGDGGMVGGGGGGPGVNDVVVEDTVKMDVLLGVCSPVFV